MDRVAYAAFETVPRADEIRAVRRAAKTAGLSGKKIWISCLFPRDDDALPDGTGISQVIETALGDLEDGIKPWGLE